MSRRYARLAVIPIAWLAVSVAALSSQSLPASQASATSTGTAKIGGIVTSADKSEQPVRRAIVRISAPELRGSREVATDDRGRFIFSGLPAGRYQVAVAKA